eukprot:TRINITY_DN9527_c0_g8_i1.p1 TRINITY_DN9527_c0_g8~~TRINITY_DN9527_c0_g8_i1.p1  ORF type:complete len:433 (-),score=53.05 TRINITY_DN9527_c0_g8_i1:63-1325(-)
MLRLFGRSVVLMNNTRGFTAKCNPHLRSTLPLHCRFSIACARESTAGCEGDRSRATQSLRSTKASVHHETPHLAFFSRCFSLQNDTSERDKSNQRRPLSSSSTESLEQKKTGGDHLQPVVSTSEVVKQLEKLFPRVGPYLRLMRVDKPIGTWLVFWPCSWSIALASPTFLPDPYTLFIFALGAFIMRGAGCTINDVWDKDIDAKVVRTQTRPIASGEISRKEGILFFGAQMAAGLSILLTLNNYSILMGIPAALVTVTYPLMKRFTQWPQAYLGLAMNYGIILGWTALKGDIFFPVVLPLYAAGVCWTLVYDTIYAHQDKEDDLLIGVKSTALLFGDDTKKWLSGFGMATMSLLCLAGYHASLGWPFYAVAGLVGGSHLLWQISSLNINDSRDCLTKFQASRWFGIIILFAIILGKLANP